MLQITERTLVLVKPDGVSRGLIGEITTRLERIGLKLIGLKMVKIDEAHALKHYGANDEWDESIGSKMKDFFSKIGFDPGENLLEKSNRELGEMVQRWNVDYLTAGRIVAMIWEGTDAVKLVRKMVGPTYPSDATPGTIRGDYSHDSPLNSNTEKRSVQNLVHASGRPDEATDEIELWFKKEEILS